ncbi:MAG TPA: PEGA domain-containing protein [Thermoanaerobaculia bacterium]|nr:PEGA domain-containing protein [Thermoanaerobaculia bacterium]
MRSLRRAAAWFRDAGSIPLLAALLLIAAGAPLAEAGERSRPNDSSDSGRSAQPRDGGGRAPSSPPPSYSPPPSSAGGSEPRVAVPRTGGGSDNSSGRQRPHNPSGGGRDHWHDGGGYYGGGYYGGGYYGYGPRYYPYFGPSWGWGWGSWWWDDYYGYGYGPYSRAPYRDRYYDGYNTTGALDIDVSPGKTEVWIDGRYTGTADDFDGFPQYLWLDRGVYDVVLFREGYKTIARQVTIRSGQVISMGDRMEPGDSVRPQDLATKTHDRRDERVRSEEERREEIARRGDDGMDDWRDRARRRMEERDRYEGDDRRDDRREDRSEERGASENGTGRLRLDIEPSDASVYLDGRFVGTALDLQRSRNGLRLEPGEHRIAVVRPGRQAEEQEFTVAAGEDVELEFELDSLE